MTSNSSININTCLIKILLQKFLDLLHSLVIFLFNLKVVLKITCFLKKKKNTPVIYSIMRSNENLGSVGVEKKKTIFGTL
jgi:lipopolysaccharide/colanic/teichoic acid biosynthesis glycosyltransferase